MFDPKVNSGFLNKEELDISHSFSDFELIHPSKNGYTQVFKAKRYGRWNIIKCLTPEAQKNPFYQTLLEKEFNIAYGLQHPNVVRTLGFEQVKDLGWCIIQEYIDGFTPQHLSRQQIIELCNVIDYIHQNGVIHRDIKPDNLLIDKTSGQLFLIDFGLADKSNYSVLKSSAGTTGYISPDQAKENITNIQTDLYSLGATLNAFHQHRLIVRLCQQKRFKSAHQLSVVFSLLRPSRIFVSLLFVVVFVCCGVLAYTSIAQRRIISNQGASLDTMKNQNIDLHNTMQTYEITIDSLKNMVDVTDSIYSHQNQLLRQEIEELKQVSHPQIDYWGHITYGSSDPNTQR